MKNVIYRLPSLLAANQRQMARAYCQNKLQPRILEAYRNERKTYQLKMLTQSLTLKY